uniref:Rhs element Vgr protein n=1 Tax=Nonomuraea gerenzanensis TaxID=93944 RepID=A0A1M4EJS1_9ACTN|nr:Rhs element Vgr protein [Nonomuraea gerenzanensis]
MTGDVLSPRWSTDDTDEQPAIQVVGNETYILPPDRGALTGEPQLIGETPRDVLADPAPPHDVLAGDPRDVLGAAPAAYDLGGQSGPHDVLGGYDPAGASGPHDLRADTYYDEPSGPHEVRAGSPYDELAEHSGPHRVADDDDDNPYLPLDRSYESGHGDDLDEERPKRGFLGSGWTDDSGDSYDGRSSGGEGEVRRRTRVLLVAAVAVVLVGVGAGWMLTGTSSDDPCAGVQCASAGEVTSPSESAAPEEAPVEEPVETPEPTDSVTDEPSEPESAIPTPTQERARPTREAEPRPTPTRQKATTEPTRKATGEPQDTMNDTADSRGQDGGGDDSSSSSSTNKQDDTGDSGNSTTTQPPAQTQAPAPTPTQEERKGLLDILFPWA